MIVFLNYYQGKLLVAKSYLFILFSVLCFSVFADVDMSANSTPLQSKWKSVDHEFRLELVQVKADYVRAVFLARGLPADVVEKVSQYCVFGNIIRNQSNAQIVARLSDWRAVTRDGVKHKLKLKSAWTKEWRKKGIAFRWLILSEDQSFDAGDWIQGFSTIALKPGQQFDLHYSWKLQGKTYSNKIKGVTCASASKS